MDSLLKIFINQLVIEKYNEIGMEPVSRRGTEAQRMTENDLNFSEAVMKTGISRGVNGFDE